MSKVVLVAGGTAGHINAALSMGEYFEHQDWQVDYLSGTRFLDKKLLPQSQTQFLETRALRTKNPLLLGKNIFLNFLTFLKMMQYFRALKPNLIVGAGGYVCGPTLMAGYLLGIPVFIIEQNAIAGLTNRILQKISRRVFTHFNNTKGIDVKKVVVSGNPVRSQIRSSERRPIGQNFKILVFGGSLGALQINDAINCLLQFNFSSPMKIVHQVGANNTFEVKNINPNVQYEQLEYIDDMGKYYEWADLIIARAGASTIAELRVVQKPCILVPYPAATDNHQYFNAVEFKQESTFMVEIANQELKDSELAKNICESILKIHDESIHNDENVKFVNNPCEIIYSEVVKYVRNK